MNRVSSPQHIQLHSHGRSFLSTLFLSDCWFLHSYHGAVVCHYLFFGWRREMALNCGALLQLCSRLPLVHSEGIVREQMNEHMTRLCAFVSPWHFSLSDDLFHRGSCPSQGTINLSSQGRIELDMLSMSTVCLFGLTHGGSLCISGSTVIKPQNFTIGRDASTYEEARSFICFYI